MDLATRAGWAVGPGLDAPGLRALAERIGAGDRAAEVELLGHLGRGVARLARRRCRPLDPAAEDVAQDVLLATLERLRRGALRDAAALPAYLRTAVLHAASALYRGRREQPLDSLGRHLEQRSDPGDEPDHELDAARLRSAVAALLAELPVARDRELIRRFYLLEQERDQVCAALGVDPCHFHRVIHRARQRFGGILARHGLAPEGPAGQALRGRGEPAPLPAMTKQPAPLRPAALPRSANNRNANNGCPRGGPGV